jgi:hypothetical protein
MAGSGGADLLTAVCWKDYRLRRGFFRPYGNRTSLNEYGWESGHEQENRSRVMMRTVHQDLEAVIDPLGCSAAGSGAVCLAAASAGWQSAWRADERSAVAAVVLWNRLLAGKRLISTPPAGDTGLLIRSGKRSAVGRPRVVSAHDAYDSGYA